MYFENKLALEEIMKMNKEQGTCTTLMSSSDSKVYRLLLVSVVRLKI